jgi:hypothetical protein
MGRTCRDCPVFGCGSSNLARLANHLDQVHGMNTEILTITCRTYNYMPYLQFRGLSVRQVYDNAKYLDFSFLIF